MQLYNKIFQIDPNSYNLGQQFLKGLDNLQIVDIEKFNPSNVTIIIPKGLANQALFSWIKQYKNYILIDNGYWGNYNSKKKEWFRITYNSLHNFKYKKMYNRSNLLQWPDLSFNSTKEVDLVALPNSYQIQLYNMTRDQWIEETKNKLKDNKLPTIWRTKPNLKSKERFSSLFEQLKTTNRLITHISISAVEAALYNIDVVCHNECLAFLRQSLTYDEFLNHIAWSQYHIEEFNNSNAWNLFFGYTC